MTDLTYSTAAKIAEPVTTEELAALIAQDQTATIWRGPGCHRYEGWNLRLDGQIVFTYCFKGKMSRKAKEERTASYKDLLAQGMSEVNASRLFDSRLILSIRRPIFRFDRLGRVVRWEEEAA